MKATLEVELQPFVTPNFVRAKAPTRPREEGLVEAPTYPLSDLDSRTLDKLCEQFKTEVFKKAGKEPLPQCEPTCSRCDS